MADYDPNQKHPKIDYEGEYPNLHVVQGADGHQLIRSLEPGKESFFQVEPTGNYTGYGPQGQRVSVAVGKTHDYVAGGSSSTVDGHLDQKVGSTMRQNVDGGVEQEIGGSMYSGVSGAVISGSLDSKVDASVGGDGFHVTEGNIVTDHTGDVNHNVSGSLVQQVTGDRADIVSNDWAVSVQQGSLDAQVDSGKVRIKAAQDILIESDTKITLRVGGSYMEMTPNKIVVYAPGQLVLAAFKEAGVYSANDFVTISGRRNRIRSRQGTQLEAGSAPPAGQINAPK